MNAQTPSTAIANVEPAHQRVAHLAPGSVAAIVPQTFDDVYRFAQVLARSGLVPYGMDTPEKVSVAILTGLEIGVKPMQAVQGIAVINGAPRIWGDLALATVRGSGQLEQFKETLVGTPPKDWTKPAGEELDYKAVCLVKRRGEDPIEMEYSISDAIVAKLWNKSGPKGPTPWVTNPKRMLKMRARAFALRDAFTDILKGMPIAEEMIGDEAEDAEFRAVTSRHAAPPPPSIEDMGIGSDAEAAAHSESAPAAPLQEADTAGASNPIPLADAPAVPSADAIDPEAELQGLEDKLCFAKTSDDVETWYAETDIEAVLAEFDGMVERARGIRDEHLRRVSRQEEEAPTAPAAEEASDEVAPPPPADEAPAAPPAEDMSTPEAYEQLVKDKLAAAGDFAAYSAVRDWWSATRPTRHSLGITDHADIARLQGYFAARKDELEAKG